MLTRILSVLKSLVRQVNLNTCCVLLLRLKFLKIKLGLKGLYTNATIHKNLLKYLESI